MQDISKLTLKDIDCPCLMYYKHMMPGWVKVVIPAKKGLVTERTSNPIKHVSKNVVETLKMTGIGSFVLWFYMLIH